MNDENDLISQPETESASEVDTPASDVDAPAPPVDAPASQADLTASEVDASAPQAAETALSVDEYAAEEAPAPISEVPPDNSQAEPAVEPYSDDLDVDAALAAVASLSDLMAEQEAAEQARVDAQARAAEEAAQQAIPVSHPMMPRPPMTTLRRGQPASVVPAVLLMAVGAWLTFALTTSPTPPDSTLVILVAVGGLVLALVAHWLSSGRWSRGVFFFATLVLFTAAAFAFLMQPISPGLARGWPLLLIAIGLAFLLTTFMTRPRQRRLALPGFLLIVGGLIGVGLGMGLTNNQTLAAALAAIAPFWPVAVAALLLVWLLPLVFRRQRRDHPS